MFGEENNRFSGSSGKTVTIQLSSRENLADLLGKSVAFFLLHFHEGCEMRKHFFRVFIIVNDEHAYKTHATHQ